MNYNSMDRAALIKELKRRDANHTRPEGTKEPKKKVTARTSSRACEGSPKHSGDPSQARDDVYEGDKLLQKKKANNQMLTKNPSLYNLILDTVTDGWWDWNIETGEGYLSPKLKTLLGYAENELPNEISDWKKLIHPDDLSLATSAYNTHITEGKSFAPTLRYRCKDGTLKWISCRGQAIQNNDGKFYRILGTQTDLTLLKETEQKLKQKLVEFDQLAHFDAVTHLPNRAYFYEVIERTILKASRTKSQFALLYLDMDDFKKINDTFGHSVGDMLLEYASKKIRESIRAADFVARLGGDEFVAILDGVESPRHASLVAQRIIAAFGVPGYLDNHELHSSVSIGLAIYPSGGADTNTLMKNADLAMYRAKATGKNSYQFYSEEINCAHEKRMHIEACLRHAIEKNELSLVYQPQFSLLTEKVSGLEVLLRWETPSLGQISPMEFIPIAEEIGLIPTIGSWVLNNACQQFQSWASQYPWFRDIVLVLSVNLSVLQLTQSDIAKTLAELMANLKFKPAQLMMEVTETTIMRELEPSTQALKDLYELGIGVAIDDFGTGYSSLSYLKQLPFTALKIDQSFVKDVTDDPNSASIVKAIIQLGDALDLELIAEGIETKEQLDFLKEAGCRNGQGYYFSHPLPPDELIAFMKNHS